MECWDHTPQPHPGEGAPPTNLPRRGKTRSGVDMLHWGHKGKRKVLWSGRPGGLVKDRPCTCTGSSGRLEHRAEAEELPKVGESRGFT